VTRTVGRVVAVAIPVVFLGWFFVYPLVAILATGLTDAGRIDLSPLRDVLGSARLRGVAWFTIWQACASTILTLLVGLPAAYVLARYEFPGRRLVRAAVIVPFVLPTVVVGTAFLALLGPGGPLGVDLRRTVWAILLAHVFYNVAVVVRTVGTLWERLDPTLEDAAAMLGAGRWRAFREVTLPLLRPAIASAASIVFLFTFTSFGVILILGGFRFSTLETEIYTQATALFDLPVAAAISLLQLAGVGTLLLVYSRRQARRTVELALQARADTARRPATWRARTLVTATVTMLALLVGSPIAVLVLRSVTAGGSWTISFYRGLGASTAGALAVPPGQAIVNSLRFATAATVLALGIGMLAAVIITYRRGRLATAFDAVLMLPLGTSAVTIGFGFLVALGRPVDLRTSPWLVPVAHALVAIPFVVRAATPVMAAIPARLREAAAVLGAGPGRAWREVDLPIATRAALVGAGFAFAVSLGEFGATSFIARPSTPTLPVAIFRLLGQPGAATFGRAMALATILMALTATAIILADRFRLGDLGDF
jgi:thiamine transport system permease protein